MSTFVLGLQGMCIVCVCVEPMGDYIVTCKLMFFYLPVIPYMVANQCSTMVQHTDSMDTEYLL